MADSIKKDPKTITHTLAAATCALLGTSAPDPVDAQEDTGWDFNTSLLIYAEDDDRVQDGSLTVLTRRTYVDDRFLTLGLTVDGLTGASPTGALPMDFVQTITQPSGNNTFVTQANELPIDETFRDTRVALTASWQQPWGRLNTVNFGASVSNEFDYLHLGVNAKIARDFNNRNTTLSAGLALSQDTIDPVGGIPTALSEMLDVQDLSNRTGDDSKDVIDVVFGVSQVVTRNFVVQANYSYSQSDGYLTDPYKIVTVVDGTTGDAIPRVGVPGLGGPSHVYRFESRPDERSKHSLYLQGKYYMDGKVLDASYRYMTDDWEIDSHTLDLRLRWPVGERAYLEPHLRYYQQSEAEFYTLSLVDGAPLPQYASADHRLGDFDAITAGVKYGWTTRSGQDWGVRLEFYRQSANVGSAQLIGNQAGRDNVPDLNAVILQVSYKFAL